MTARSPKRKIQTKDKAKAKAEPVVHFRAQPCKNPPAVYFEPKLASAPRIRSLCTSSKVRKKSATPKKTATKSKTEFCHRKMQPWSHFKRVHRTFSFFSIFFLFFPFRIDRGRRKYHQESLGLNP